MAIENEEDVLEFWNKKEIYSKLKKKNSKGNKFYFMDGPPYATGHIHMGTALNKVLKDVAIRSQRMQGKDVFDRPGYDTHGLPIEMQVEKEIGSKSKQDIERYGVREFIEKCREYATKYIGVMNDEFKNLGVWMDWDNPYKTLDNDYIEAIWNVLKKAYEKKLLYLGNYPVHACPRCATAVAFNEIEYELQKDNAIYVKFPIRKAKNSFLIIWTTTPWTLPANTGVMVHPDVIYSEIKTSEGENWIIANDLVDKRMEEFKINYKVVKNWKGSELVGLEYDNPVSKHTKIEVKNGYRVVSAPRYVTITDGTGLVHCAPGHGKEDFDVGNQNKLDNICPVGIDGIFDESAGEYSGGRAREIDKRIVDDLREDGFLVHEHGYSHDYPLCWRCKTPLLMVSVPQWFLRISEIKKEILDENEKVSWLPKWAQSRMKAWLEGISDWPISRERYWGTPLPIWKCDVCEEVEVIGNVDELKKKSKARKIDMHKPGIDEIVWTCKCRKGEMRRVSGVFDVWFDSGATSWAALGYPRDEKKFKKYWPADLNIEGTDQFRGWWNSQLILSIIGFGEKPYKAISVHGLILDISKRKMSKSLGNVVSPQEVVAKYGRDYLRHYLVKFSRGEDFSYNEKEFTEIQKFFTVLLNLNNFLKQIEVSEENIKAEDKWILSRYNSTFSECVRAYNEYKFYAVIDLIENFVVNDLSRTYIQSIRDRAGEVKQIIENILVGILKLLGPITPFLSEKIWQQLKHADVVEEESVHLSLMPSVNRNEIDSALEEEFKSVKGIVEKGLAERDRLKIGLKWPLSSATYMSPKRLSKEMEEILARQLNVKRIINKIIKEGAEQKVSLDPHMSPQLEGEGFAREIIRRIQAERKKRGMKKTDRVRLSIVVSERLKKLLLPHNEFIANKTGAEKFGVFVDGKTEDSFEVRDEKIGLTFLV